MLGKRSETNITKELVLSPEIPKMKVGVATEKGKRLNHPHNEDTTANGPGWFAICDGMGGQKKGEQASQLAANNFAKKGELHSLRYHYARAGEIDMGFIEDYIEPLFRRAHTRIHQDLNKGIEDTKNEAGTTASVGMLFKEADGKNILICGNVGDSTIAIFDSQERRLIPLTLAHISALKDTYPTRGSAHAAQERIMRAADPNELGENDHEIYKKGNMIHKMLGLTLGKRGREQFKPYVRAVELQKGQGIVAFTDGMEVLTLQEMEEVLSKTKNPEKAAKRLLTLASKRASDRTNPRAKEDDRTVIVIDVKA